MQDCVVDQVTSLMSSLRKALRACIRHADLDAGRVLHVLAELIDETSTLAWPELCSLLAPETHPAPPSALAECPQVGAPVDVVPVAPTRDTGPPASPRDTRDLQSRYEQRIQSTQKDMGTDANRRSLSPVASRGQSPSRGVDLIPGPNRVLPVTAFGHPTPGNMRRSLPAMFKGIYENKSEKPSPALPNPRRGLVREAPSPALQQPSTSLVPTASPQVTAPRNMPSAVNGRGPSSVSPQQPLFGRSPLSTEVGFRHDRGTWAPPQCPEESIGETWTSSNELQDLMEAQNRLRMELERLQYAKRSLEKARRTHQDRLKRPPVVSRS